MEEKMHFHTSSAQDTITPCSGLKMTTVHRSSNIQRNWV